MMHAKNRFRVLPLALTLAAFAACDGSNSTVGQVGSGGNLTLKDVSVGRLVDIYSFQMIDTAKPSRLLRSNRRLELIAENVVINPNIESQSLFTAAGSEDSGANYEFLRFDKLVGHEQLVILWDNRPGAEEKRFQDALADAQVGLTSLPPAFRGQNTATRPIPIVPRNAAVKLTFDGSTETTVDFFRANPSAIQLLEFKGDTAVVDAVNAFRILPYRVVPSGNSIVLDTTILGGEAAGGITSSGLPLSADNVTANIRVAIPTRGQIVSTFFVEKDGVSELNGVDSGTRDSVIRDFRSGNLSDGPAGRLSEPEAPQIVGSLQMGITAVDAATGQISINKRNNFVPIRGRYPFVDGPLLVDATNGPDGRALGPLAVPTQRPLTSGDQLIQEVTVQLKDGSFEIVTLRAEILENERVKSRIASSSDVIGLGKAIDQGLGGVQGELHTTAVLRVATAAPARDSDGELVFFQANALPLGSDCTVRTVYVEEVPFTDGSGAVSDRVWRNQFVRIEPAPAQPGVNIDPDASISIEFTKPMDLDQVDNSSNLLVTNTPVALQSFAEQMGNPKTATTRIVPTRLTDLEGDGTVLRLQPPMGFAHDPTSANPAEAYSVHVRLGVGGVIDLAGNQVEVFDDIANPQDSWSVDFTLDPNANANNVGWYTWAFEDLDEDGSLPGSVDLFGQVRYQDGRLIAAEGVRFNRTAQRQTLAPISRITRGECWNAGQVQPVSPPMGGGWVPVDPNTNAPHPGQLYWDTEMRDAAPPPPPFGFDPTVSHPVGRVIEPLKPQGSRMQMRYIEDDFQLSYREPSEMALDIEQLYWSQFNNEDVLYDVYDRVSMRLGHARKRGDEAWALNLMGECVMDCASCNSGLELQFSENILQGTELTPVFTDRIYTVNPNEVERDNDTVSFIPYPRFDTSYTWRDSRLVTVDADGAVIGLGGAQNPGAVPPNNDTTARIDSPWITSVPDADFVTAGGSTWVVDGADFNGFNQRDHDPIALPLLVDIMVFADDPINGSAAGGNGFQVAMLGPPDGGGVYATSGYYDRAVSGCGGAVPAWPRLRVHTSGGFDLISGDEVRIDAANVLTAVGAVNKDVGLGAPATGLFQAPAGDGMLHWARADFARKVSTATFGFIDTLRPTMHHVVVNGTAEAAPRNGFPDWTGLANAPRISDLVVQLDPPANRQPAGTGVVVELRGAESFDNDDLLYNPTFANAPTPPSDGLPSPDDALGRGNLLNPNYACEAYRYSTANNAGAARVSATGLTRYVTEDQLNLIRSPATGLLPRFLNLRLVMTNNLDVQPTLSPSLRSMSVVYRLAPSQN